MNIDEIYITTPESVPQKPFVAIVEEVCEDTEPKSLFCEFPDELRFRPFSNSGSVQTYTTTSSSGASGYGTSTTTTTP